MKLLGKLNSARKVMLILVLCCFGLLVVEGTIWGKRSSTLMCALQLSCAVAAFIIMRIDMRRERRAKSSKPKPEPNKNE